MINVRYGIFETNSSSTHAMIMCMEEDYEKLSRGSIMIGGDLLDDGKFVTREAAMTKLRELYEDDPKGFNHEYGIETFEDIEQNETLADEILWREYIAYTLGTYSGEYMDTFVDWFTTPNGEKVYAFGYYGQDG